MTRVPDYASQQSLLLDFMRTQRQSFETQQQISSGKVSDDYKGIGPDVSVLVSAKAAETQADNYVQVGGQVTQKLEIQNLQLEAIAQQAVDLRQAASEAVANNSGVALMEQLEGFTRAAINALNTEVNGVRIFAGSRTDTPPVNISTLDDLEAAGAVADVFDNDDLRPATRLGDNEVIEYGFLAEEIGTELFESLKRIADYNAGPNGPFSAELTGAQATFLQGELNALSDLTDNVNVAVARNGVHFNSVEQAVDIATKQRDLMTLVVADIEDVDLAEAATRLNQDQVAMEATARVLADATNLSLLNFI
ncbi:MAG: flagellin [Pseudomonadota bacterium]